MAIVRTYSCSVCKEQMDRNDLTVKKASFLEMGVGGRMLRSRVVGHLCPNCLGDDPDYNKTPFSNDIKQVMRPDPVGQNG